MRALLIAIIICWAGVAQAAPLRVAMVTSLEASGLAPLMIAAFEAESGDTVEAVFVGSGQAFVLAARGDVDVILTHDPAGEEELRAAGITRARLPVMQNRFVLLGPPRDPAGIADTDSVFEALCRIARDEHSFVSRGDRSGTHRKEQSLWRSIRLAPAGRWYRAVGSGMAASLRVAGELQAYALADRASALKLGGVVGLRLFSFPDPELVNLYAVSLISKTMHPHLNHQGAERFARWLTGPDWQGVTLRFLIRGKPVYRPAQSQSGSPDRSQTAQSDGAAPQRKNAPCRAARRDRLPKE